MKVYFQYTLDKKIEDEWNEFWNNSAHTHPQHHVLYGKVERAKGNVPVYVYGRHNDSINCIGIFSIRPIILGNRYSLEATCLRGPVFDDITILEDMLLQIISYFKSLKVGCIRISPFWFNSEAADVVSIFEKLGCLHASFNSRILDRYRHIKWPATFSTSLIDLQKSHEEIYESFYGKSRRMIQKAKRLNVKIRPAQNVAEAKVFYDVFMEMCTARGIKLKSYPEFKCIFENFLLDQEMGICLFAYYEDIFLGGQWLIRGTHYAHAIQAVVSRKQLIELDMNSVSLTPMLTWEAINWAKEHGCLFYDLEGSSEDLDESHPMYGVYKAKKQLNPLTRERITDHVFICNQYVDALYEGKKLLSQGLRFSKKLLSKISK